MRLKIGILTHHYVSNYGAFLQAYCLRDAIADLFPEDEVVIIDFINLKHSAINYAGCFRFFPGRETARSWLQKTRSPRVFSRARKKQMRLTKTVYTAAALNKLGLDKIVVGSDEVWNYKDKKSYLPVKFGCGIDSRTALVSYAASVGGIRDFSDRPREIDRGMRAFSSVSARDDNTAKFIRELLGIDAVRVMDPVFLHALPSGLTERVKRLTAKPYMPCYHCAPLCDQSREGVLAYAKKNSLRLLGAGEFNVIYDEMSQDLSPFEWAELFKHAEYVITGTFHGAVFSIINRRQFSVCPNNPTRAEKLSSLLRDIGLSARLESPDSFDMQMAGAEKIEYDEPMARIRQKAESSREYLRVALSGNPARKAD